MGYEKREAKLLYGLNPNQLRKERFGSWGSICWREKRVCACVNFEEREWGLCLISSLSQLGTLKNFRRKQSPRVFLVPAYFMGL